MVVRELGCSATRNVSFPPSVTKYDHSLSGRLKDSAEADAAFMFGVLFEVDVRSRARVFRQSASHFSSRSDARAICSSDERETWTSAGTGCDPAIACRASFSSLWRRLAQGTNQL